MPTIQNIRELAEIRGGKCLSKEYINSHKLLSWMCKKGHTWDASYSIVKQGGWCASCAKNEAKIDKIRALAEAKDGSCLSEEYQKSGRYKFQCSNNHIFFLNGINLKSGAWCILCYREKEKEKEFNTLKKIVEKNGGTCLSNNYENKNTYLKIDCGKGHEWKVKAIFVKKGKWCPDCVRADVCKDELKNLNDIARKKGGRCLSESFSRTDKKLRWQCKEGHIFYSLPKGIKKGTWCDKCARVQQAEKTRKYDIDHFRKLAKKNGGELLSKEYVNITEYLEWKCAKGHTWKATPGPMIYQNHWCGKCAIEKKKRPIAELHQIAEKKGGKLLSEKYINNATHLKWQCDKGHIWLAAPRSILNGGWCIICADKHYRITIDVLHADAKKKGGKLLSEMYKGMETKLKWQCKRKHIFMSTPHHIRSGNWCRQCANEDQRDSLEVFQKIAKEKGGKLLSTVHVNSTVPLEMMCKKGHVWKTSSSMIKKGAWCRKCAAEENAASLRYPISVFQSYAKSRGGQLITKEYINKEKTPLIWKCSNQHIWVTHGSGILTKKSWCGKCFIESRKKVVG